jgi:isopentenyl-diphosphate delta-isomerase
MSATEVISAPQDLHLIPDVSLDLVRGPGQSSSAGPQGEGLEGYDEEQIAYMTDEWCIVVDEKDLPIGSATKEICMCYHSPALGASIANSGTLFI